MMDINSKRSRLFTRIGAPKDSPGLSKSQEKKLCDYAGQMGGMNHA